MTKKENLQEKLDKQTRLEMRFNNVDYMFEKSRSEYTTLLNNIIYRFVNSDNKMKELRKIRIELTNYKYSDDIINRLLEIVNTQKRIIEKVNKNKERPEISKRVMLNYEAGSGQNIAGTFKNRNIRITNRILDFIYLGRNRLVPNFRRTNRTLIDTLITSFMNYDDSLLESMARVFRNYTYNKIKKPYKIKGWVISTIFDRLTCPICVPKRYKFFSIDTYGTRDRAYAESGLQFHIRCRCWMEDVPIYAPSDLKALREDRSDLDRLLRSNRSIAVEKLGKRKAQMLFDNPQLKGEDFYDFANGKLYTNEQLERKYKLGRK